MNANRILVVDDEEVMRSMISAVLTAAGYPCATAESGCEALALLHDGQGFALMLSDVMMPQMDGIELLKSACETSPDMPVVMVTAVHDISVALTAVRSGAFDYLTKPFEREQLLNVVARALEDRRLKLENREYQSNLEGIVASRTEQLRETMADLERSYDITLEALGDALDLKDAETEGHSKRVTAYTIAIAQNMGLPADEVHAIARGAFLHDIGKMAIPDAVLRKPGALTADETMLMREHCSLGYQMIRKIPFLTAAAEIVYAHQEHFDGTGYPRGLKGEEIPLGARIFAIADTLDAITSDRPYRAARSIQAAKEEILRCSGRQFDPAVVSRFTSMADDTWRSLREQVQLQHKAAYLQSSREDAVSLPRNPDLAQAESEDALGNGCEHAMIVSADTQASVQRRQSQDGYPPDGQSACSAYQGSGDLLSPPQRALVLAVAGGTKQVATTDRAITIRPYAGWELLPKQARVRALVISVLFVLIVGRYATSHRATTAQNPPVLMTAATLQNAPASSTPAPSPQNAAVTGDSGHSPRAVAAKVTASTTAKQAPASLRINVEHHFTSANLRIVIDRRLAYTHELRGNVQRRLFLLRKVEGSESDALKLSPGKHAIQVSVESSVDAPTQSRTVVGRFVSGRQTILQINFTKNGDMNVALL